MKKLIDLKQERSELISKMEALVVGESMTDEQRSAWSEHDSKIKSIDNEIALLERQDELNKTNVRKMENNTITPAKSLDVAFRDYLKGGNFNEPFKLETRDGDANGVIISSTETGIINKTVNAGIDILTSPAEAFLKQLGITFFTGLNGNFTVPSMGEDTAAFAAELGAATDASMLPAALTLAARRVTHQQRVSKELLAQTNPAVFNSVLQNLYNGVWNAVTNDVFDTLETDAADRIVNNTNAGTISLTQLVNLEASINALNIGSGAYVMQPQTKAYLKKTAGLTNQAPIWVDDEVNGYPAFGVPAANTERVYFGDFSRACVGQWGGLEIIVDPYTKAANGEIVLTVVGLFDTGVYNKRAFAWYSDASTY